MSNAKKLVRKAFRDAVFVRDGFKCVVCGTAGDLDAHHIVDRTELPSGGYVKENGISLCGPCHLLAEVFHSTGKAHPGFAPSDLYDKIKSNLKLATEASLRLDR